MPRAEAPLVKSAPPMPRRKIVDAEDNSGAPGVSKNLLQALAGAENGDVIYIKHGESNLVEVPPITLRPNLSVTLKPYEGCQPILVLDKAFTDKDSALFKVQGGTLQFEQMQFLLDPVQTGRESLSVVHVGEAAHCIFKKCVVSLRTTQPNIELNVVTFVDLDRMMKMDSPAPPAARVEFHECFVRGKGDLVSLRGCRLLYVEMKNSLVALDGSLLDIDAKDKNMPMGQGVRWKMERTSVFTTDSIFALRSKTGVGLTKTQADIDGCLFVSLLPEKPIVLLDMKNGDLDKFLDWRGEQNFYANFDKENVRAWKDLFSETDAKADFGKLALPKLKLSDENRQPLWEAELDWFKPAEADQKRVESFGLPADAERTLMQLLNTDDDPS
jgi:hypothetical protein